MIQKGFFARRAWYILLVFAVATPFLFEGAARAVRSNTNKVEDWLPSTFAETKQLRWFRSHFGSDGFIVISWDGCVLGGNPEAPGSAADDPRIERLAKTLIPDGSVDSSSEQDYSRFFKAITTGRRILNELTAEPSSVPYETAVDRLGGTLIGPDGRQTCVVLTLTEEAVHNLRDAIGRGSPRRVLRAARPPGVLFTALRECGIDINSARLGGPPVDNAAIDEEGERTLVRLAGLSGLLGLGLAWWSLRSIRLTLIVFSCGVLSAALGLAIVWWSGESMDAVLMSMPSLVYVLAISGAVHLVNYYRDALAETGRVNAAGLAMSHGWRPALLCSITTAVGLASLCSSELEPIRKFGLYSAAGVMGMLVVLFLFLPAALQNWPLRIKHVPRDNSTDHKNSQSPDSSHLSWMDSLWHGLGGFVIRHHTAVTIACFLFIGVVGLGITRVHTSIDLLKLFDGRTRILADYAWLEHRLGNLVPMEIVIQFPQSLQESTQPGSTASSDNGRISFLERMETIRLIQRLAEREFGPTGRNVIGQTFSAATFAPELPSGNGGTLNFARRSATNKSMLASRDAFVRSGYLRIDPKDQSELWRISLRIAAFEGIDYGTFVEELRQTVDPVLIAHRARKKVIRELEIKSGNGRVSGATVLILNSNTESAHTAMIAESLTELLARDRIRVERRPANTNPLVSDQTAGRINCAVSMQPSEQIEKTRPAGDYPIVFVSDFEHQQILPGPSTTTPAKNEIAAVYTGVVPIVYKAQRTLLNSLIQSTFWSFVTITPIMMFVSRGVLAGSVVMLPNVLPVLVVFGGMGWLGIAVDIGSMMSASIALGVAVDDTIHFLSWFRGDLDNLRERHTAILAAYRRCATPTLQAAMISGMGLSVFAFSTFTPTQRFGWLMLTILMAGVVAELIMLPAILAGPMGRVFQARAETNPVESSRSSGAGAIPTSHIDRKRQLTLD